MKRNILLRVCERLYLKFIVGLQLSCSIINPFSRNKAYIFGCPTHLNMGDQAQTYCIKTWIKKNYPHHKVILFPHLTGIFNNLAFNLLKRIITKNDMIFGHSGYFMIDHHLGYKDFCRVIKAFQNFKIIIFPQTINFKDLLIEKNVAKVFNSHPNVTLMCRDKVSYTRAKEVFIKCNLLLYPDVVTSLIGKKTFNNPRNGVLFVKRNDTESYFDMKQIEELKTKLYHEDITSNIADTSIKLPYSKINGNRERILFKMIEDYSKYELIITDRYHGTIFSLISNTPVIVISSTDHKLSSGVDWFPEDMQNYITYVDNLDDAFICAKKMLNATYKYKLPQYFDKEYYSVLKGKI